MREIEKEYIAKGYQFIAGIDEAGRGPLAGPVVAAAVHLPLTVDLIGITDSKRLSPKKRLLISEQVQASGFVGIGVATHTEIDNINILQATFLAMRRAVAKLAEKVNIDFCIIDGNQVVPDLKIAQTAIVKGDASCYLVAAASIVAKVYRDSLMAEYDLEYPEYGFGKNKGYPTKEHLIALANYGPSPIHRFSFARVKGGIAP